MSYGSVQPKPRALHAEVGELPRLSRPRGFVVSVATLGAAALLAIGVSGLLSSARTAAARRRGDAARPSAFVASTKNGLDTQCIGGSYDTRNLVKGAKVSFDTTSPMILHATVDVSFSGEVFQHSRTCSSRSVPSQRVDALAAVVAEAGDRLLALARIGQRGHRHDPPAAAGHHVSLCGVGAGDRRGLRVARVHRHVPHAAHGVRASTSSLPQARRRGRVFATFAAVPGYKVQERSENGKVSTSRG